jgi:ankyrin repeat protein
MQALSFQAAHTSPAAAMTAIDPLYQAATQGDVGAMEALLADPRVNPSAHNSGALRGAVYWGQTDAVRLLLADGRADPAAEDYYALWQPACAGHLPIVSLLLADGRADPAAHDSLALWMAGRSGHVAVVRALLADGRVNHVDGRNAGPSRRYEDGIAQCFALLTRWLRRRPWLRAQSL